MRSEPSTCAGLRAGVGQASGEETAARATVGCRRRGRYGDCGRAHWPRWSPSWRPPLPGCSPLNALYLFTCKSVMRLPGTVATLSEEGSHC